MECYQVLKSMLQSLDVVLLGDEINKDGKQVPEICSQPSQDLEGRMKQWARGG